MKSGQLQLSEHSSSHPKKVETNEGYLFKFVNQLDWEETNKESQPSCTEALWREQLIGLIRPKTYSENINNEQTKLTALRFSVSLQPINNNFAVEVGTRNSIVRKQPLFMVVLILLFFVSNYSDTLFAITDEDCNDFNKERNR